MSPAIDAQEMNYYDFLDEVNASIKSENYKDAINSLQMTIGELEKLMLAQIRSILPTEVLGYTAEQSNDESSGTAAMACLAEVCLLNVTITKLEITGMIISNFQLWETHLC